MSSGPGGQGPLIRRFPSGAVLITSCCVSRILSVLIFTGTSPLSVYLFVYFSKLALELLNSGEVRGGAGGTTVGIWLPAVGAGPRPSSSSSS